jgi:hypothetical protein
MIKYHHQHLKEEFGCMNIDLMQHVALVSSGSKLVGETIVRPFLLRQLNGSIDHIEHHIE